jgi:hypothetical protein
MRGCELRVFCCNEQLCVGESAGAWLTAVIGHRTTQ